MRGDELHVHALLEENARATHADIAVAEYDSCCAHEAARTVPVDAIEASEVSPITSATT